MIIAKEFTWEMGHRLPEHFGKCKNIHGHSYKLIVELEGYITEQGLIMDFYDLKKIVKPVLEKLDHSFMVFSGDKDVISFLEKLNSKRVVVSFPSTVENIAGYLLEEICKTGFPSNVSAVRVRVYETDKDYAETEKALEPPSPGNIV
jgi:6-pyruvoyltetrahydropterin/6-carboxytetrahydropterin synthase